MKIEKKNLPKSELEITIELAPEEFDPYLKKTAVKLTEEKRIEGFRPGKAPYEIVKQRFGEAALMNRAVDLAIQEKLAQIIKDDKLEIVAQPKIDLLKLAPDNPLIFKIVLVLLPKITKLADYRNLKIKRKEVHVEPKEVDQLLGELQNFRAKETLENKTIEKGDRVELDFDISVDRVALENGQARKYPVIIGEGRMVPGFEDQLLGLKAGETKKFKLTLPQTHFEKRLAGKEAEFKVTINNVYRRELPLLNDDLAKSLGGFSKLEDLKKQLEQNLLNERLAEEEQKREIEILDRLIQESRFEEIPANLITSEAQKMLQELEEKISAQGLKFDDYLTSLKKTRDQLLLDFTPEALKRIKAALLIREIAEREKIRVKPAEIETEVNRALQLYPGDTAAREKIRSEAYRNYLRSLIINRKVLDLLKSLIIT